MQKKTVLLGKFYRENVFSIILLLWSSFVFTFLLIDLNNQIINKVGIVLLLTITVLIGVIFSTIQSKVIGNYKKRINMVSSDAEKVNKSKCDFFANMSHELRTPLNAIFGFTQLMLKDSTITEKQLENLNTIQRSSEHLLSLINNVLEFSKIEAGRSKLVEESFDFHYLLINIKEMFLLRALKKGLTLTFNQSSDLPRFVKGDQNKLSQILINIISNAIKFTETGSVKVNVKKGVEDKINEKNRFLLNIEIEDTGIGMYPLEQERIFNPFFQNVDFESQQQGTGLGLPICKQLIDLMGGTINLCSKVSEGSTFILEIPIEITSEQKINNMLNLKNVEKLEDGQQDFKLLVVEDNEINRKLLISQLQLVGFSVKEAANGADAVRLWQEWHPDLIWMDMKMPILDGYAATEIIKSEIKNKKIDDTIIIALTASVFEDEREKIIACGCSDFVRKPAKESELYLILEKYLNVKFKYQKKIGNNHNDKKNTEEIKADIHSLPVNVLASLKEATELSDADRIEDIIKIIDQNNPKVAYTMQNFAENFAYDDILNLLGNIKVVNENYGKVS